MKYLVEEEKAKWVSLRGRQCLKLGGDVTPEGLVVQSKDDEIPDSMQGVVDYVNDFLKSIPAENENTWEVGEFFSNVKPNHVLVNRYEAGEGIL